MQTTPKEPTTLMQTSRIRKTLLCAALIVGLAPALPALSASSTGTLQLDDPIARTAYASEVPISWSWKGGNRVNSRSVVYFQASPDQYRWYTVRSWVPIRDGSTVWDTTGWPEGTYALRGIVHRTWVRDVVGPIVVDRTAPKARITRPSEGDVIVEDTVRIYGTLVVGTTTLEADSFDYGTGVQSLVWELNGEEIGRGSPFRYNFGLSAGRHTLTATATDGAGNTSSHSVSLIAGPGPSLVAEKLPEIPEGPEVPTLPEGPGQPDPSTIPDPRGQVPSEQPTPPAAPTPSDVPTPAPGSVPQPDPSTVPKPPSNEPPSNPGVGNPPSAPIPTIPGS